MIPEKRITKGFDLDFFISSIKFGGLIRRDWIEDFSSFERLTSFRDFPVRDSFRDSLIASTVSYATLFWSRMIWSSSKSSSNFSSVRVLEKKLRFFLVVGCRLSVVGSCAISFFGFLVSFFLGMDFFFVSFLGTSSTISSLSFPFLLAHFLSLFFSVSNMEVLGSFGLRRFWF